MVKTGYISFITETPAGQDGDGNVTAASKVNSLYIECNLNTLTKDYKVLSQGQYQDATYSCIIDSDKIAALVPSIEPSLITEVQIQDNHANDLGVFQVVNLEFLDLTKRVKIVI